ncbi:ribosome maturation factor RimM [Anaerovorax odorimutans]|uniref:Ribosome maturation factor RimM n=1 Tax=Anaerovorax odorimutans TaxID=109327 RepID=A0ABT1RRS5_9FIRM|nr:ribosome maturation factor RimM [Anaerovorax odorimutans]MCQ4637905.1 ribosome maturation factor RimM [Anaerovorax odorimutans]
MEKIKIGKIVNAVGLKGEVKVYCYTDRKEQFEELERIYVGQEAYEIKNVRYQGNVVILRLSGIDDRNAAEAQKNRDVSILESDLIRLPEDTYYVRDLIGIAVEDEADQPLGSLSDVLQNTSQDLYEIKLAGGKKILLPAVREFVISIDMENRKMKVKLPEGLLDL